MIRSSEAVIRKMLEIKIALAKEDLAAFHKASRGLNQSMTYSMSNAIKKVVKSHKGTLKITKSFLDLLENIGSFQRDKIPLMLLRRMYVKRYITASVYGGYSQGSKVAVSNLSLKKNNPALYAKLKKEYLEFVDKKAKDLAAKKEEATIEPIKKAATTIEKISKILEAFVVKVFFNLKKLVFAVVDERAKVEII